uniref:Uncharacterized protein n=1 Tax=Setaria viridis TaxID=4556 RepID=A0A4U6VHU1_SETVI|nr:hypothetical protein SEVIR_3G270100v2 [Setaria viridis]
MGVAASRGSRKAAARGSLFEYWLGAVLYRQAFLPVVGIGADGSQLQCEHVSRRLLAPAKIDCQDHAMMALGVVLNRQWPLQDKHKQELDEHWRAVHAQARKL